MRDDGLSNGDVASNVIPLRRTRFAPAPRGGAAPVVGTLASSDVVRAFGQTGGGWLHVDGAAVSQGSLEGTAPLRMVASVRDLVGRLAATRAVMEHLRERGIEEERASQLAAGMDPEDFWIEEISEQMDRVYAGPDEARELAAVGWYRIEVYRIGERKVVGCDMTGGVPMDILQGISDVARTLGCKASGHLASPPSALPSLDDEDEEPEPGDFGDLTADSFRGLPGFASYDPKTRVVSFVDRDTTVTLPGGLGWTPRGEADVPAWKR